MEKKTTSKSSDDIVFCLVGKDAAAQPDASVHRSRTTMWSNVIGDKGDNGKKGNKGSVVTGGSKVAGSKVAGSKVAGSKVAGSKVAGSKIAGSKIAGSKVAGSKVAGSKMTGSKPVAPVIQEPSVIPPSSSTKSKHVKAAKTGSITVLKEGGHGGNGNTLAARSTLPTVDVDTAASKVTSTTRVPAGAGSTPHTGPASTCAGVAGNDSTLKTARACKLKTGGTASIQDGSAARLSGGDDHVTTAAIKPKPTMTEKLLKTKQQAQKVCKTVIESKILVSIMVFLCTMLLLICLNPPMAQEQDSATKQRSWKKIMVWSSLAMVLALLLPYTCKPVVPN